MTRRTPRRGFWKDEEGVVTAFVLVFMGAILGIFATMKSLSMRYTTLTQMQTGADAAALAAARTLVDPPINPFPTQQELAAKATQVRKSARDYAEFNMWQDRFEGAVADKDIVIGNWNPADGFTPNAAPLNAVRVVTQQSAANGNQHRDFLPAIVGAPAGIDLRREAIAYATASFPPCILNGFAAGGTITAGSDNLLNGFCLHADDDDEDEDSDSDSDSGSDDGVAIDIKNNNAFEPGARVGLDPDAGRFKTGNNTVNTPSVQRQELDIISASEITARLAEIRTSNTANELPPLPWMDGATPNFVTLSGNRNLRSSNGTRPVARAFYIVTGNVTITGDFSGFGVYATGNLTVNSNTKLQDVFLASAGNITVRSNVSLGALGWANRANTPPAPTECDGIDGTVFMMAGGNVTLDSSIGLSGAQVIASGNFTTNSNNLLYGVSVQTAGNVEINSNNRLLGCGGMAERMLEEPADPVVSVRLVR